MSRLNPKDAAVMAERERLKGVATERHEVKHQLEILLTVADDYDWDDTDAAVRSTRGKTLAEAASDLDAMGYEDAATELRKKAIAALEGN